MTDKGNAMGKNKEGKNREREGETDGYRQTDIETDRRVRDSETKYFLHMWK